MKERSLTQASAIIPIQVIHLLAETKKLIRTGEMPISCPQTQTVNELDLRPDKRAHRRPVHPYRPCLLFQKRFWEKYVLAWCGSIRMGRKNGMETLGVGGTLDVNLAVFFW
jgi:hypothetical protein